MNPIEDVPIPIVELLNLFSINLISYSVSYGSSGVNLRKYLQTHPLNQNLHIAHHSQS